MNELLFNLKEKLSAMIEEIDGFTETDTNDLIIRKKDFKYIKHLTKLNSYIHLFEYKKEVKFVLRNSSSYPNDYNAFRGLTNGILDVLILNKLSEEYESDGYIINYRLESEIDTTLRNLYSPIKNVDLDDEK